MVEKKKNIAILGSTGSIGTQALDVIRANSEAFAVEVITGNGNADLLIKQAIEFNPNAVVIADESKYQYVKDTLKAYDIKVYAGNKAITEIVKMDSIDMVLAAIVGFFYSPLRGTAASCLGFVFSLLSSSVKADAHSFFSFRIHVSRLPASRSPWRLRSPLGARRGRPRRRQPTVSCTLANSAAALSEPGLRARMAAPIPTWRCFVASFHCAAFRSAG